jgi:hypothetical protein
MSNSINSEIVFDISDGPKAKF